MLEAPIPADEERRLSLLRACNILYTPEEESFDDVARLAADLCGSEIALITLLQIVLGPLLVWLAYREQPPVGTLLGGVVIMAAVVVQAAGDLRRYEPAPVAPD